ncbi:glycosyltransferase family 2 protein [Candidatus Microgenomates bacterium]|nr:MAG: glycosyltransferase family 2 protein [Candidatus Microgenomates bacterium]
MKKITIVIPALNEEKGIGPVLREIPVAKLNDIGYKVEILVIDNDSDDNTPHIARKHGASVIIQPIRGYGNAYKAGFANATGDIIATGDADLTYPFCDLPKILKMMEKEDLDFVNTNRLKYINSKAMSKSHIFGNWMLTAVTKLLYSSPFKDSQSGMWIFKKSIWKQLKVKSSGMPFSQEIKIEAHIRGFKCAEVPIRYRARAGKEKLNTVRDGIKTVTHLFLKKFQLIAKKHAKKHKLIYLKAPRKAYEKSN